MTRRTDVDELVELVTDTRESWARRYSCSGTTLHAVRPGTRSPAATPGSDPARGDGRRRPRNRGERFDLRRIPRGGLRQQAGGRGGLHGRTRGRSGRPFARLPRRDRGRPAPIPILVGEQLAYLWQLGRGEEVTLFSSPSASGASPTRSLRRRRSRSSAAWTGDNEMDSRRIYLDRRDSPTSSSSTTPRVGGPGQARGLRARQERRPRRALVHPERERLPESAGRAPQRDTNPGGLPRPAPARHPEREDAHGHHAQPRPGRRLLHGLRPLDDGHRETARHRHPLRARRHLTRSHGALPHDRYAGCPRQRRRRPRGRPWCVNIDGIEVWLPRPSNSRSSTGTSISSITSRARSPRTASR